MNKITIEQFQSTQSYQEWELEQEKLWKIIENQPPVPLPKSEVKFEIREDERGVIFTDNTVIIPVI